MEQLPEEEKRFMRQNATVDPMEGRMRIVHTGTLQTLARLALQYADPSFNEDSFLSLSRTKLRLYGGDGVLDRNGIAHTTS
jgi:hypothetical protein